ncbi:alpha-amylase family protein [Botrimarina sp.]|uniref:alpha-amylase family protein n=1 Tax=Botrimarina sp. TaxID=2795802 RepID=UPI0032F028FE
MHCPDWDESILSRFDAEEIVARVVNSGADALYFFAKDTYGNTYYPSQIGKPHPALDGRDFVAEVLDEGRKHGLPIVIYCSVIWDNHAAEQHPEWRMLAPDGRALSDTVTSDQGKWRYVCHNSPYADYVESIVAEIADNYEVAGFHLDMFNCDFGGLSCYCDYCRRMFQERFRSPLPTRATWDRVWRDFLEFRYDSVERLMVRLREAARRRDPELPVVMNYHGAPGFDWRVGQLPVRHAAPSSMATGETYTPMFGDMYPGMEGRFVRAIAGGKPFEMVSWRMNRITDFTVKGLHQLRWEVFTGLAHGGSVMLIDQPFHDGRLDPAAYDQMTAVFAEAKGRSAQFGGEFLPHVGLYYSAKTRDWYGRESQEGFVLPVMGAYKALVENHFQVDFLFDETVSAESLSRFPVVFLPNTAILSTEEQELLREYVRSGGRLIATFDASLFEKDGTAAADFHLADVYGVRFEERIACDNCYYQRGLSDLEAQIDAGYNVLCQGEALRVTATTASAEGVLRQAFHKRRVPDHFFSHNVHPPCEAIGHAEFRNRYGDGECVYLPFGLDRSYADAYELPEHRQLIGEIVRSLAPPPLVDVRAPLNCEALIRREGPALHVHLSMFNPLRQSTSLPSLNRPVRPSIRMEEPALYRAELRCERTPRSVSAANAGTRVERLDDRLYRLTCEDVFETITLQF